MQPIERIAYTIRHMRGLQGLNALWNRARPAYRKMLMLTNPKGIARTINGTDFLWLDHELHGISAVYEPDVWRRLMAEVRVNDVVVDVGAYIGLYTLALARRVGSYGHVFAFEPEAVTFHCLKRNVSLNGLTGNITLVPYAVGEMSGFVPFAGGKGSESSIDVSGALTTQEVKIVTLDSFLPERPIDILKIDVEGHEYSVLKGAEGLLRDTRYAPRIICIEMHPYAWEALVTTDRNILDLVQSAGYATFDIEGKPLNCVNKYSEIICIHSTPRS